MFSCYSFAICDDRQIPMTSLSKLLFRCSSQISIVLVVSIYFNKSSVILFLATTDKHKKQMMNDTFKVIFIIHIA